MKTTMRLRGVLTLTLSVMGGCKGSVSADANVSGHGAQTSGNAELSGSGSGEVEGKGEMTRSDGRVPELVANDSLIGVGASRVLLGARHDLKLKAGQSAASCQCLAVALGGTRSASMSWSDTPPEIDETTQLAIALSSDGQSCPAEPAGSLGASYWGYRISGNDVIVVVEAARGGRPLTSGAIIPKPVGSGQVFVAPASKKLPYGRGGDGKGVCKIGNPGRPRVSGFTDIELGTDAPTHPAMPSEQDSITTIELPEN